MAISSYISLRVRLLSAADIFSGFVLIVTPKATITKKSAHNTTPIAYFMYSISPSCKQIFLLLP